MDIRIRPAPERQETRLLLEGRFDAYETDRFREAAAGVAGAVCVDLAGVPFIDSSGLTALIGLYRRCRERGAAMRIVGVQDPVRLILEITHLLEALPVELEPERAALP